MPPFNPTSKSGGISFGRSTGPYAGKTYDMANMPADYFSSSAVNAMSGSSVPTIAAPNLTPFEFSPDSKSYPTYLRNLGENAAQQAFQRSTNRIGAGNSQQNLMHAQDALNNNRLAYMSKAGQENLAVDNSMADAWNKYNALLAQLYGYQVQQRGQDVNYAATQYNANSRGGEVLKMGGPQVDKYGNPLPKPVGTYTGLQDTLNKDMNASTRSFYNKGYF